MLVCKEGRRCPPGKVPVIRRSGKARSRMSTVEQVPLPGAVVLHSYPSGMQSSTCMSTSRCGAYSARLCVIGMRMRRGGKGFSQCQVYAYMNPYFPPLLPPLLRSPCTIVRTQPPTARLPPTTHTSIVRCPGKSNGACRRGYIYKIKVTSVMEQPGVRQPYCDLLFPSPPPPRNGRAR